MFTGIIEELGEVTELIQDTGQFTYYREKRAFKRTQN